MQSNISYYSQYHAAVIKDPEFTVQTLDEVVTTNLQLQYGKVNYATFSKEYSAAGWFGRKVIALPMALWFFLVKAIYDLARALFTGHTQHYYKAYRDLQAAWGYLSALFNDRYGSYHIQGSAFHLQCYDCFNPQTFIPKSFKELENINSQSPYGGVRGEAIFVDITSGGGDIALQKIKDLYENQPLQNGGASKTCHFGVACFFNFSVAAAHKVDKIVILDYDPVVVRFNKIARDLLIHSENSIVFQQKLIEACQQDEEIGQRQFHPLKSNTDAKIGNLAQILNMPESFLSNEENFKRIKRLAEAGEIHILQGSIYDTEMISKIVAIAQAEGVEFRSLFISNIYDWNTDQKKQQLFLDNMKSMSSDRTVIVEVVPSKGTHHVNVDYYINPLSKMRYDPKMLRC